MKILAMGLPPWGDRAHLALYKSQRGHEVRTLSISGEADYTFTARETVQQVLERLSPEWTPDVLFCGCPEMYPPPLELENTPILTAAAISDWNLYQPQMEHNLARFDVVLSDAPGAQKLVVQGAEPRYFFPLYSHRSLIHRDLKLPRDIDVLFLGNRNHAAHRERGRLLERVARLSGEYQVLIDTEYPPDKYAEYLNRARIVLNHSIRGEMNLRCFETVACGALLFMEKENLEVWDWLEDGREAISFHPGNIESQLRYYLENEQERAAIAAAGLKKAPALSAEHRMDTLFDWLAQQDRGGRAFQGFAGPVKALAEVLLYGASREPTQRALAAERAQAYTGAHPRDIGLQLAVGCIALERGMRGHSGDAEPPAKEAVRVFHAIASRNAQLIVPWMNLAVVAGLAGNAPLERQCLDNALAATDPAYGGLWLGKVTDPYYADWRMALALGNAHRGILHAAASARRAAIALQDGEPAHAITFAGQSRACHPGIAKPYQLAAYAESHLGRMEAAATQLEAGLPHTLFDSSYRKDLIRVREAIGRREEARALAAASACLFRPYAGHEADVLAFEKLADYL